MKKAEPAEPRFAALATYAANGLLVVDGRQVWNREQGAIWDIRERRFGKFIYRADVPSSRSQNRRPSATETVGERFDSTAKPGCLICLPVAIQEDGLPNFCFESLDWES